MPLHMKALAKVPREPGIYVLYGGRGKSSYAADVGSTGRLRLRLHQHLVSCESNVVKGANAVSLNPEFITEVEWYTDKQFATKAMREAAEEVAFDYFCPVLRSRAKKTEAARLLLNDPSLRAGIEGVFMRGATGRLDVPSLHQVYRRLEILEKRLNVIEKNLHSRR